jgi:penicillin-binding protein 1C
MELRSLVGSVDFFDDEISGQVNGTAAKRSPGSTLKPFVYGLGMDQSVIHPLTMLKDAPRAFSAFNPENFDHEFSGPVMAKDALVRSRNLPALEVAAGLTGMSLYGLLKAAGVTGLRAEDFYGLAMVLGGVEVTMEELVGLYAMLARGGELRPIKRLKDEAALEEAAAGSAGGEEAVAPPPRLLSEEAAYLVLDILKDNPRPGQSFRNEWTYDPVPVYWKTGTSYAYRDAWAVGIVGPYVIAVWVGNFDGEGNPAFVGRTAAGPLFFEIIDAIKSGGAGKGGVGSDDPLKFVYRSGVEKLIKVEVCSVSGQLPTEHCPHTVKTWFIPGRSPIEKCEIHRPVAILKTTGMRACTPDAEGAKREVYEFWPSDLLRVFRRAGLPRRVPPPYDPSCGIEALAATGMKPRITSPRNFLTYTIRAGSIRKGLARNAAAASDGDGKADGEGKEKIPLAAITDADTSTLYWFMDEKFLGTSGSGDPYMWTPRPGSFVVRVVDDHGRSDARDLVVEVVE